MRLEECSKSSSKALLNGPLDASGAILTINARDGGTDANDWAEMLLRMYIAWAKKNGYEVELLDRQDNEEAGITHAAIAVRGPMAYGYLKGENGHAPAGADQPVQRRRKTANELRGGRRVAGGLRRSRSRSMTKTSAKTFFGPAAPAAST